MLVEAPKMTSPTEETLKLCIGYNQALKEDRIVESIIVLVGLQVEEKYEEFQPIAPQQPANDVSITQEPIVEAY